MGGGGWAEKPTTPSAGPLPTPEAQGGGTAGVSLLSGSPRGGFACGAGL